MKAHYSLSFCCLVAVLSLPALAFGCGADAGVMRSSGAVTLNGSVASSTTALFGGDRVETIAGGGCNHLLARIEHFPFFRFTDRF